VTANVDWNVSVSETMPVIRTLSVSPTSISHTYTAGTETITVNSSDSWTSTSSEAWCTIPASGSSGSASVTVNFSANSSTSSRSATITIKNGHKIATISVSQDAQGVQPVPGELGNYIYSVGLISDIHFHTLNSAGNRVLQTKSEGNSNNDDASSLFKEDFKYLISVFEQEQNFLFIASPGDIATYDLNDFIYFTDRAQTYLGNHKFYCATGNHDHGLIYYAGGLNDSGKFLNPAGTQVYGNSTGGRWERIESYDCPKKLAGSSITSFGNTGSYYVQQGNDIYVFVMT
jgi:hypothetical protein